MERCAALRMYIEGIKETVRLERERRRAVKEATVFARQENTQQVLACTQTKELFKPTKEIK